MKIKSKLLIIYIIFSIVVIFLIGALFNYVFINSVKKSEIEAYQKLLENKLEQIDYVMYERLLDIEVIANSRSLKEYIAGNDYDFKGEKIIQSYYEKTGPWDKLSVIDINNEELFSVGREGSQKDYQQEEYMELLEDAKTGRSAYSDVILRDSDGSPTMLYVAPLRNDHIIGSPIEAIVLGEFSWQVIIETLESFSGKGAFHLYNVNGLLIACSESHDHNEHMLRSTGEDVDSHKNEYYNYTNMDAGVLSLVQVQSGFLDYDGNNWKLEWAIPDDEAYEEVNRASLQFLIIMIPVASLSIILFLSLFLRVIIKPIEDLEKTTEDIISGDLDKRAEVKSNDEIGLLATSFNAMTKKLVDSRRDIEKKVLKRTKELKDKNNELENEKKNVENQRDRISAIVNNIEDGIIVVDLKGKIISVNISAAEIIGLEKNKLVGNNFCEEVNLTKENQKVCFDLKVMDRVKSGRAKKLKGYFYLRRSDMLTVIVTCSVAPLRQMGKVVGGVVVIRDVTKHREVDKAKTEFVSLASHQLRTPLSAIGWFAEMLLNEEAGKLNNEQKEYLQGVYDSNKRMVNLVNSLLNVSRLEMGSFSVEPELLDVRAVIDGVINELKPSIKEKKLNISKKLDKLPKMKLDHSIMKVITRCIITNAIQYTPEKGKILVELKDDKEYFIIVVHDSGYGIPENEQPQIFSKLYRAENIKKYETDGSGLGLYLTKLIMDQINGRIWFESEENKGTSFYLKLPKKGMNMKKGNKKIAADYD